MCYCAEWSFTEWLPRVARKSKNMLHDGDTSPLAASYGITEKPSKDLQRVCSGELCIWNVYYLDHSTCPSLLLLCKANSCKWLC